MKFQPVELVGDEMARARHEAGAHAKGFRAETQVETGGLDLIRIERGLACKPPLVEESGDRPVRQYSCFARHEHSIRFPFRETKPGELTQAGNGSIAALSRGDLAGRLAATLNK